VNDSDGAAEGTPIGDPGVPVWVGETAAWLGGVGLDTDRGNIARIYDWWLGGKDNFRMDRKVGAAVAEQAPWVVDAARANRAFLQRAVTFVAGEGVDQFLDIGAGLPTMDNVHQIARRANPASRVVYVDNDPVVLAHARALLEIDESTVIVMGDARDPAAILGDPVVRGHLDWGRPIGVLLVAVLHFLTDTDGPAATVRAFRDALPPGSYLVLSHATGPGQSLPGDLDAAVATYQAQAAAFVPRTRDQVAALLGGWDLLPPGLVGVSGWRPVKGRSHPDVPMLGAVARLPHDGATR
jgi:S-adenosyl methyltransferase